MLMLLEHLNVLLGAGLLALAGLIVCLLLRMLGLQRRQLLTLEAWLDEQRAINQRQLAAEQTRVAEAQASFEAEAAREQQVVASRQSMADAVATLRQLKRQFG